MVEEERTRWRGGVREETWWRRGKGGRKHGGGGVWEVGNMVEEG